MTNNKNENMLPLKKMTQVSKIFNEVSKILTSFAEKSGVLIQLLILVIYINKII